MHVCICDTSSKRYKDYVPTAITLRTTNSNWFEELRADDQTHKHNVKREKSFSSRSSLSVYFVGILLFSLDLVVSFQSPEKG